MAVTESAVTPLRAHARQAPWNARGLAAHATGLTDAAGLRPTNAAARAALSARAVRFYVANGLLDRPDGKGTAATYGYRHLLQLLAIKIRQREGKTLVIIKQELHDTTGDALERRVAQALAPAFRLQANAVVDENAAAASWRRVRVGDGIELHVRDDLAAARDEAVAAMLTALRTTLGQE